MWYKTAGIVMELSKQLNVSMEKALALFYSSKTCEDLHNPDTLLYTFSDSYVADEVIAELKGM